MTVTIFHNPRCSKSRQTLQLLQDKGVDPKVREYLKEPPSAAEIENILKALDKVPRDVIRKNETPYADNNLGDNSLSRTELVAAMAENPILIERPIVINGARARIGRPPESVLEIL